MCVSHAQANKSKNKKKRKNSVQQPDRNESEQTQTKNNRMHTSDAINHGHKLTYSINGFIEILLCKMMCEHIIHYYYDGWRVAGAVTRPSKVRGVDSRPPIEMYHTVGFCSRLEKACSCDWRSGLVSNKSHIAHCNQYAYAIYSPSDC